MSEKKKKEISIIVLVKKYACIQGGQVHKIKEIECRCECRGEEIDRRQQGKEVKGLRYIGGEKEGQDIAEYPSLRVNSTELTRPKL